MCILLVSFSFYNFSLSVCLFDNKVNSIFGIQSIPNMIDNDPEYFLRIWNILEESRRF